ncbi:MAG: hypothetical protein KC609_19490 [Myxococcales bacterium]|nr:hypothetical protein [Myxococcales bacterium]
MAIIRWVFGDAGAQNLRALTQIEEFLAGLKGRAVIQRTRTSPYGDEPSWLPTAGDGWLHLGPVEVRGTTVYYLDLSDMREKGVMASRIDLDLEAKTLTIYSGRAGGSVFRIEVTEGERTITLSSAHYALEEDVLVITDRTRSLVVRVPISASVAKLFLPYFQRHDALKPTDGDLFRPGERCPLSGQWEILYPYHVASGTERTVVRGEPFPPTPTEGALYRLADATKTS